MTGWSIADENSLQPYVNAYGDLRSPWNNNPSINLGRYNMSYHSSAMNVPGCDSVNDGYHLNTLAETLNIMNGKVHGYVVYMYF